MAADKSLKDKTIKVKGGAKYAMVKDRVQWLDENKPGAYSIDTKYDYYPEQRMWVVKATLTVDDKVYSGHAQEIESDDYKSVNHTSALENCETSAIGRACAAYGIGIQESYASGDEVAKAQRRGSNFSQPKPRFATMKQIELMVNKVKWGLGDYDKDHIVNWLYGVLGKSLNEIRADEVDDALAKIDKALREDKVAGQVKKATEPSEQEQLDEVAEVVGNEPINLDEVPY